MNPYPSVNDTITQCSPSAIMDAPVSEGGNSCSLKGAVLFSYGIKGALPLLHAGPGCSFTAYYGHLLHSGEVYPFANSAVCSNEIIFGGENKLREAIRSAAAVYNPEIIVAIPGCQPITIGDDMKAVVHSLHNETPSELLLAEIGGYEENLYDGFVKTGLSFLKKYCRSQPVKPRTVNIISFPAHIDIYWKGDMHEIRSLLNLIGLEIGCFLPGNADLESIRNIPGAALNLVVDEQMGLEMAQHLESTFGTPYITPEYGTLIGTDNTLSFFRQIIERLKLGDDCNRKIEEKRDRALQMAGQTFPLWSELIQHSINTFLVNAPASMAMGLVRVMTEEFGLEPKLINLNASCSNAKQKILALLKTSGTHFSPIILENADDYQITQQIGDQWPKIVLGKGTTLKADALLNGARVYMSVAYPALDRLMVYNRPIMGFNGVPSLLDDILSRAAFFF